jgi:hypothetical protein
MEIQRMKTKLKIAGLIIGLIGLLAAFSDLMGWFLDEDKLHISESVWNSKGGIPRNTPGFEKFLLAFPPPEGVDPNSIAHIVKNVFQMEPNFTFGGTLRYLSGTTRTAPVASFDEVRRWAEQSKFRWIGWVIALIGWIILAVVEILDILARRRITPKMR